MNKKHDTALRIAIWALIVVCAAISVYYALHNQHVEAGAFVLGVGQNVSNLILLRDTE